MPAGITIMIGCLPLALRLRHRKQLQGAHSWVTRRSRCRSISTKMVSDRSVLLLDAANGVSDLSICLGAASKTTHPPAKPAVSKKGAEDPVARFA